MSLRIQTNIEAFNAHRQLVSTSDKMSKAMERLSSGYRINKAADDAAGLAISEKLRARGDELKQIATETQGVVSKWIDETSAKVADNVKKTDNVKKAA